ncbi:MAG: Gfo/Idh/MocA family protein [Anaerolineae bacterium]
MDGKTYTASVVGGGTGGTLSLRALAASHRFALRAAADLREDVRHELAVAFPGLRTYATHQEMYADCPTDVVCVATWPPSHRQVVLDALQLNLAGILCEKPLADTAAAGRELLEAIQSRRLPIAVPHGLLKARHTEQILERVRAGEIGELELVEIECTKWDVINAGIHWLNYFVNLTAGDPPAWVMAQAESSTCTYRDGMEVETTAVTYVQTVGGVRAVMHTGDDVQIRRPGKNFHFRLLGTRGVIEFYGWESRYFLTNPSHPLGELFLVQPHRESGHQRHLEAMAAQIDSGLADYGIAESSLTALQLCEGTYLSSAHRCKVSLPLWEFQVPPPQDWRPGQPYRGQGGRDGRKL